MSVSFSKITNVSLKERTIRELEQKILSGELQAGDKLPPEREIAAAMGVSRSLLNLCILELENRGFVRIVPRQGTFVKDYKRQATPQMLMSLMNYNIDRMDRTLFDNMMDTRRLIECECTRLAIQNASDSDFEAVAEALSLMEKQGGIEEFIEANFAFHHALTAASGNAVYAMIFNSFSNVIHFFSKIYFQNDERRSASAQQHRKLYEAICGRDEPAALDAIGRTLDMGITGLAKVFKR